MDRNGLRPIRYTLTKDFVIAGSETGMVEIDESKILRKRKSRSWPNDCNKF